MNSDVPSPAVPDRPLPSPDARALDRVLDLLARLRAPDGCPWDREQTPATLKPQLLEECYEVLEAIDSGSKADLVEELGDLLLHIAFQAQIAREAGDFTFADVATELAEKLVRRHPHVFGSEKVADATETIALWDKLKKAEKTHRLSALDGVPKALPALMRAEALQKKARKVGFDWPEARGALEKVEEEIAEVRAELAPALATAQPQASAALAEEIGDLLFAIVNLARHLHFEPEMLLTAANDKFTRRFRAMEDALRSRGREMKACALAELEDEWTRVKSEERTP
jgi:MazG family protein